MTLPSAPFPRRRTGAIITPMKRALIVDDQDGYLGFFCRFLGLHGFSLVEAADGGQGLALARSERPDLIFMDWCLTDRCGLDVVRDLRSEPATARIPVVVMSGLRESAEDEAQALRAGADFFMDKRDINPGDELGVNAFLRHMQALMLRGAGGATPPPKGERLYQVGDLCLNAARVELTVAGLRVHLKPKPLALLEALLRQPGVVHAPQDLWRAAWGTPRSGDWEHALAVAVHELRTALGPAWAARIENLRARGYRLTPPGPRST